MTPVIALVLPFLLGSVLSQNNGNQGTHSEYCDPSQNGNGRNGNYGNGSNGNGIYFNGHNGNGGNNGNNGNEIYNNGNNRNNGNNGNGIYNNGNNGNNGNGIYNNGNNGNGNGGNGVTGTHSSSRFYRGDRDRQGSTQPSWGRFIYTPDLYEYRHLKSLSGNQQSIRFQVRARNDAYIGLHQSTDINRTFTEILIGGWRNTRSVIRSERQGQIVASRRHSPLDGNTLRDFWIRWDGSGRVSVGQGLEIDQRQFLTWRNPQPYPYRFLSITTGYGSSGQWRFEQNNGTGNMEGNVSGTPGVVKVNTTGDGNYVPIPTLRTQLLQNNGFPFFLRAAGDAHIYLRAGEGVTYMYNDMYEILLGSFNNTVCEIKRNGQMVDWTNRSISGSSYLPFWISFINGTISVGEGVNIGNSSFLSFNDTNPFNIQNVSITTINGVRGIWYFK